MSWEMVLLGDVIETLKGYAFKSGHYVESGVPIVRASNFTMDSISNDDLKFYTEDEATQFRKYELSTDDVLIQTVGSWESNPASVVGKVVRVPQLLDGALLNQNIVKVFPADKDQLDLQYLFYRLKCHDFKRHNIGNAVGAANQASITLDTIRAFAFLLPNIVEQRRIATILRGYDDLIENNQKQIKLLEEAAQRLYKEWFVDLRFPGHETTPISDGIPEGWTERSIADVCIRIGAGGTPSRSNGTYWKPSTIKWFKTGELMDCWLLDSSEKISEEGLSHSSAKLFPPNTILMAIYASPTLGRLGILTTEAACNQAALCLVANGSLISWQWLYQKLYELRDEFNAVAKGAGQQNISADVVKKKVIIIPNKECIDRYTSIVAPMFDVIRTLQEQNVQLQEARDRLLPKLMNGEIEV